MARRPVVLLLRDGPAEIDAASATMRIAGWSRIVGPVCDVGAPGRGHPPDRMEPAEPHRFVQGVVADPAEAESLVLAVASGCGAVAAASADGAVWSRFVRAMGELADTHPWEASPLAGLSAAQIELLAAIAGGAQVPAAARSASVSERSAHRLLVEARARLGARTNSHAATLVRAAVDGLG